jgi:hypothetical protein
LPFDSPLPIFTFSPPAHAAAAAHLSRRCFARRRCLMPPAADAPPMRGMRKDVAIAASSARCCADAGTQRATAERVYMRECTKVTRQRTAAYASW